MTASPPRVMQLVSNLQIGGAQEVVRTLAGNLSRLGCFVVVCAFEDGPLREGIERLGVRVEILPRRRHPVTSPLRFIGEMLQIRRALAEIVAKYRIDVVQTHLLRSLDFLALSLRRENGPQVFWTFHNALFDLRADHLSRHKWLLGPKRAAHHLLYRLGSRRVDGIVAVSEDVKKSILETIRGIPPAKVSVILNCVELSRYGGRAARSVLRRGLGFGETEHLMALVATFKRQKGHRVLIEAAAALAPQFPHLRLLLVGDGELRDELQARVRELNLEGCIRFLGLRRDVPEILSACDSFILPSLWEGLPMALVEAMACGLPVIATDVSGTRQVMVPGETGMLIAPGDAQEIVQAVSELLADPFRGKVMGLAARQRVETLFSARKQAREYVALFERANQRSEKSPGFSPKSETSDSLS